jgi:hypothetical protein
MSDTLHGIRVKYMYRTNGLLFNLGRLQAVAKVNEIVIKDFLFAMNAHSEAAQSKRCSMEWNVKTLVLPSAQKRLKS